MNYDVAILDIIPGNSILSELKLEDQVEALKVL